MKAAFLVLLALVSSLAESATVSAKLQARWANYKDTHSLSFASSQAESKAFATYSANLAYIDEWNSDSTKTSKLGENHFTHLSSDEMKKQVLMPSKTVGSASAQDTTVHASLAGITLRSLVNYTSYFGPVKDQGYCGSCYAFTTAGVAEGQYYMKYGRRITLSEEQILDCTSSSYGANQGCNGGDNFYSLAYIKSVGLCPEDKYNYTAYNDADYEIYTGACNRTVIATCGVTKIRNYGQITAGNENVLAAYIQNYGPVTVYIDASARSFQNYQSGVYYESKCSSTEVDHTVVAVGFGTDSSGQDFWILRNSWSADWGINGYMLLARNKNNHCAVASSPYYAKF